MQKKKSVLSLLLSASFLMLALALFLFPPEREAALGGGAALSALFLIFLVHGLYLLSRGE